MKIHFESHTCTIQSSLSRKNTPSIDGVFFQSLKDRILGAQYELSLVFIGYTKMKSLNHAYRNKSYATDILSFPIEKNAVGEIYIYPRKAESKAKQFGLSKKEYLQYLLVHGLSHLKGYDHETNVDAKKMADFESKIMKEFKLKDIER